MILFLFVFLFPSSIKKPQIANFIIWNVGQGSWATLIEKNQCLHFDMGGEKFSLKNVLDLCELRRNKVFLTHLDWDHINKIKTFRRNVKFFCIVKHPALNEKSKASRWLDGEPLCQHGHSKVKLLYSPTRWDNRNQSSHVYLVKNQVLISGDSPSTAEKKWAHRVPRGLKILILGHHGSHTSTSAFLMKRIKPHIAIASARKRRFGHPHKKVTTRLKQFKVPLLQTEIWNNLMFEL